MILARVVGNVVATRKHATFESFKMMLVRPVDPAGADSGPEMMAADGVGAGPGEIVLVVVEGRSAGQALHRAEAPLDAAIVGIVDRIDV
ncbi:MAG TPA: EutN/CcmL family microcompartment protein [Candidatus Saccharimonadales bacterium]|nr:EutN/CcmL family microcompartment protein [Candidatus Saccharimonadales bacterium]